MILKSMWLERSPSGRASCKRCGCKVLKDSLRLKVSIGHRFGHEEFCYYCSKCGENVLKEKILNMRKEERDYQSDIRRLRNYNLKWEK